MDWIKCTDRMPPDMEPVIATVIVHEIRLSFKRGKSTKQLRYNTIDCEWEYMNEYLGEWVDVGNDIEVTHWMPWPEPAED